MCPTFLRQLEIYGTYLCRYRSYHPISDFSMYYFRKLNVAWVVFVIKIKRLLNHELRFYIRRLEFYLIYVFLMGRYIVFAGKLLFSFIYLIQSMSNLSGNICVFENVFPKFYLRYNKYIMKNKIHIINKKII